MQQLISPRIFGQSLCRKEMLSTETTDLLTFSLLKNTSHKIIYSFHHILSQKTTPTWQILSKEAYPNTLTKTKHKVFNPGNKKVTHT